MKCKLVVATEKLDDHIEKCLVVDGEITSGEATITGEIFHVEKREDIYDAIAIRAVHDKASEYYSFNLAQNDKIKTAPIICYEGNDNFITTVRDKALCNNLERLTVDSVDEFDGEDVKTSISKVQTKLGLGFLDRVISRHSK